MPAPRESLHRGYRESGGVGVAFSAKLVDAYKRIVPARVVKLEQDCDRGVLPASDWDAGPVYGELTDRQRRYISSAQSSNRGKRKDTL